MGARNPESERVEKTKGMHWRTFDRLNAEHDTLVQISLAGMVALINLMGESLDDWL